MAAPNAPTLKVEIAFESGTVLGSVWTLDDPVKGMLDAGYMLAVPTFADVTDRVTSWLNYGRGRSRELDTFQTGQFSFMLRNEDRAFDPLNTTSPYYPGIEPRTQVRISLAGEVIFQGHVEDFQIAYDANRISTCSVTCFDGMGLLAECFLNNVTVEEEFPETRIGYLFDLPQVIFPDPVEIIGLTQWVLGFTGLDAPGGVAVDSVGNVYVTDPNNSRVLKLTPGGVQSTLGFTGLSTPVGICVDGSGAVYVVDNANDNVKKLVGGVQTTLGFGSLNSPVGVAVDGAGAVFVADRGNARVRKLSGGVVTTVGFSGLSIPNDVAVDSLGNVYVTDATQVKVYNGSSTSVVAVTGLVNPSSLAIDDNDVLYVSDLSTNRVFRVSSTGTGAAAFALIGSPAGIAIDTIGNILVCDQDNMRVVATWSNVRLLGTESLSSVSVLDHLQTIEKAEYGWMYVDRSGTLIIRTRPDLSTPAEMSFSDNPAAGKTRYETLSLLSATQLWFNQVIASGVSGTRQIADDAVSQAKYGVRGYEMPRTALANDADALDLANYILKLYKDFQVRFDVMTINLMALSPTDQAAVCSLDIGSIIDVELHPPSSTSANFDDRVDFVHGPVISLVQVIESLNWTIDVPSSTYKVTLSLGSTGI